MEIFNDVYGKIKNLTEHYDGEREWFDKNHHAMVVDFLRDDLPLVKRYLIHLFNICYVEFKDKDLNGKFFKAELNSKKYLIIYNYSYPSSLEIRLDSKISNNNNCIYVDITDLYSTNLIYNLCSGKMASGSDELVRVTQLIQCVENSPHITVGGTVIGHRKGNNEAFNEDYKYKQIRKQYKNMLNEVKTRIRAKYYAIKEDKLEYAAFKILLNEIPPEEISQFLFLMNGNIWHYTLNSVNKYYWDEGTVSTNSCNVIEQISYRAYEWVFFELHVKDEDIKFVRKCMDSGLCSKKLFDKITVKNIKNFYTPYTLFIDFNLIGDINLANSITTTSEVFRYTHGKYKYLIHNSRQAFILDSSYSDLVKVLINSSKYFLFKVIQCDDVVYREVFRKFDISKVVFNMEPAGIGEEVVKLFGFTDY